MRINETTVLVGNKVVLVPYRKEHVLKYHNWMKNEEILQQTASEPLSIEEEYEMQQTWQTDDDKLTFIVLARSESSFGTIEEDVGKVLSESKMAGDVNLFISERIIDDEDEEQQQQQQKGKLLDAELEVMIAEPDCRRKGLAKEALGMLIYYASSTSVTTNPANSTNSQKAFTYLPLSTDSFVAKIGISNQPSIALFEKMNFQEVGRSDIWKEAELRPIKGKEPLMQKPLTILNWPLEM